MIFISESNKERFKVGRDYYTAYVTQKDNGCDYTINCKNNIKYMNNRDDIKEKLFRPSFMDFEVTHPDVLSILNHNYLAQKLKLNEEETKQLNNKHINKIVKSMINEDDTKNMVYNYVFNESFMYYRRLVKIFIRKVEDIFPRINYKILEYIFENALTYKTDPNSMGILYQTVTYIAKRNNVSRYTVRETLKKLESIGIIEGVVGDIKTKQKDLEEFFKHDPISEEEKILKKKLQSNVEYDFRNNILIFPVLNINKILDLCSDELGTVLEDCEKAIKYNVIQNAITEFLKRVYINEPDYNEILKEDIVRIKAKEDYSITFNLNSHTQRKHDQYVDDNSIFGKKIVKDNFMEYFKKRDTKFTMDSLVEDYFVMNGWLKHAFKLMYDKGDIKVIDKDRYFQYLDYNSESVIEKSDKIFNAKFSSIYSEVDYEAGMKSIYKTMINNMYVGTVELIKQKTGNKINTFSIYKDKDLQKWVTKNLDKSELISHNYFYFRNKIKDIKITSKIPLFDVVKHYYNQTEDKIEFIKTLYDVFVDKNKNPNFIINKLMKFIG